MAVLTSAAGGPEGLLRNYWKQQLLGILKNELMAGDLMDQQVIPANSGRVCEFHRINSFSKQMTGSSMFIGYASFGDLKGTTFGVDSVVYDLELVTNDLQIEEIAIMAGEPNPIPTLTERFLYNAKDSMDQAFINIAGDLRTDATFQDITLKGDLRGEDKFEAAMIGDVFGVRVIEDENVSIGEAGTIDANDQIIRCPVVGEGYATRISHARGIGTPQVNYIPPSKADKNDPHGLVGIMTWKIYRANGGVTNPLAGLIVRVATTRAKSTAQIDDATWNL